LPRKFDVESDLFVNGATEGLRAHENLRAENDYIVSVKYIFLPRAEYAQSTTKTHGAQAE
jgi:hypothetical protein